MIYLDYAADTPADEAVLQTFHNLSKDYIANPNAGHSLGRKAKARIEEATGHIASLLNVKANEIIYTSGATESNNLAIKGIASTRRRRGKHMITTYLEHSSVTGPMQALQQEGYEVDFVDILPNGYVDLEHLNELLREDTILVSICYVDSELGVEQNIEEIAEILKNYPNCAFHVDATQAIGKIPVQLDDIDLVTFTPHKFYGLHGCGVLIKKEGVHLDSLIHGGVSTTTYRSGTPTVALVGATEMALALAMANQEVRYEYVAELNKQLRKDLSQFNKVQINSTDQSVPYILNISIKGVKAVEFQAALEGYDVYVSTKSACSVQNTPSRAVYAITKDRKRAIATLRISLSHLTTKKELECFLEYFNICYKQLEQ